MPPVFIFVVDTCIIEEEIGYLKSALAQVVELLPDNSLVGFITFGTYVQVKAHCFSLMLHIVVLFDVLLVSLVTYIIHVHSGS